MKFKDMTDEQKFEFVKTLGLFIHNEEELKRRELVLKPYEKERLEINCYIADNFDRLYSEYLKDEFGIKD